MNQLAGARPYLFFAAVALGCALLVQGWNPSRGPTSRFTYQPDADLSYLDMIALGRMTGEYLQREHPDALIFGSAPENYWLTDSELGYVNREFTVLPCNAYRPGLPGEKLIFGHLYSPAQHNCWRVIETIGARPLKQLRRGDKWVLIHRAP